MALSPGLIGRFGESNIGAEFKQDVEEEQAAEAKFDAKQISDRADNLSTLIQHGDLDDESSDRILDEFINLIPSVPGSPNFDLSNISSNREEFSAWLGSLDTLEKKGASAEALHEAFELGKRRFGARKGFASRTGGIEEGIEAKAATEEATRQSDIRADIPVITSSEQGSDVAAGLEAARLPKEAAKIRTEAQRQARESPKAIAKKRVAVAEEILGRKLTREELSKIAIQDPFGILSPEDEAPPPTDLPDASKFKDQTISDPDTGRKFKSNGSEWTEV